MAEINKINVGGTDYDVRDTSKLPKVTYEWNKEFAAGQNGAISLGRYNVYDTQLTFDITSTTSQSLSGKLVIATQNGSLLQAKVFGDATGTLISKLIIYQSAISGSRSWIEVFCNFDGWSKNKVHIYAVALNSATVEKQMTSVTISSGTPATANVTSGDKKWTGTIVNDISHSHDVSIAASSGTNELTLAHGTKYALTAGGQSFIFTMPGDNNTNTWRKVQLNGTDKLGTGTDTNPLNIKAGSNMTITESNGTFTFTATNTDTDTHYTNYLQIKGNGTEAIKYTQDSNKSLNLKPGTNVSISAASGEITIAADNTWRPIGTGATDAAAGNHTHDYSGTYQAKDADLTAIAGLSGTSGLLKKTAANTWALDTNTYLTSVPNIASDKVTAMVSYSKPSSTSAIKNTDTLNAAIGKLEKALDSKGTSNLTIGTTSTTAAAGNHNHDSRYIATGQTEALTVTNGAQTLAYGTTKTIASVAGTNITVTMPSAKVTQTKWGNSGNYALLMSNNYTSSSTTAHNSGGDYTCYWNTNLYANPSSGQITATAFYASSDSRLKENIKDYIPENSILDLPVVEFDFKDSKSHQIGCIAQDLQNLFPELVNTNEDGYLSIAENKLVYLCILEIKKLKAELEALKMSKE